MMNAHQTFLSDQMFPLTKLQRTKESSFQDIVRQVMMKFYSLLHISILSQTKLQLVNMMKFYMLKLLEKK